MRIIAGSAKGRAIDAVASVTRPTSDRAREALFSTLSSEFGSFDGIKVLDLYSGTGAIALEALSRGALLVHAVEQNDLATKSISTNYEAIKSSQFQGTFHLFSMNVQRFLESQSLEKYHFVYIDPPYDAEDIEVTETLINLKANGFLDPAALVAVERNSRIKELSWPDGYEQLRVKNYGQATIFYAVLA